MSQSIFSSFTVVPAYGKNSALLRWKASTNVFNKNYDFKILKSRDGYTDWYELPMTDELGNLTTLATGYYVDKALDSYNQIVEWHYQLRLTSKYIPTEIYCSDIVTYRHLLDNLEFGTIRELLRENILSPDGIEMFLCRAKSNMPDPLDTEHYYNNIEQSVLADTINPLTGQKSGTVVDYTSYGKAYKGGFAEPILVSLTILSKDQKQIDSADGLKSSDLSTFQIHSANYPKFMKGDMLIDPLSDDRYLFNNVISFEEFKGIVPLFFTGTMTLLPRGSEEYKYPLPKCAIDYILNKNGK